MELNFIKSFSRASILQKVLLILVIALIAALSFLAMRYGVKANREQYIFCKGGLSSEMERRQVISYLETFGDITYTGSYEETYLSFVDKQLVAHSRYILSFHKGQYSGVSAFPNIWEYRGFDRVAKVCDN